MEPGAEWKKMAEELRSLRKVYLTCDRDGVPMSLHETLEGAEIEKKWWRKRFGEKVWIEVMYIKPLSFALRQYKEKEPC